MRGFYDVRVRCVCECGWEDGPVRVQVRVKGACAPALAPCTRAGTRPGTAYHPHPLPHAPEAAEPLDGDGTTTGDEAAALVEFIGFFTARWRA